MIDVYKICQLARGIERMLSLVWSLVCWSVNLLKCQCVNVKVTVPMLSLVCTRVMEYLKVNHSALATRPSFNFASR